MYQSEKAEKVQCQIVSHGSDQKEHHSRKVYHHRHHLHHRHHHNMQQSTRHCIVIFTSISTLHYIAQLNRHRHRHCKNNGKRKKTIEKINNTLFQGEGGKLCNVFLTIYWLYTHVLPSACALFAFSVCFCFCLDTFAAFFAAEVVGAPDA